MTIEEDGVESKFFFSCENYILNITQQNALLCVCETNGFSSSRLSSHPDYLMLISDCCSRVYSDPNLKNPFQIVYFDQQFLICTLKMLKVCLD